MQAALAMPGKDNRSVWINAADKIVKGGGNITIGCVNRAVSFGCIGQERAKSGLTIMRCPDIFRCVEYARLTAHKKRGTIIGLLIIKWGVPVCSR